MKHSNRYFICINENGTKRFAEVDGHIVKNKHGLDLFWHWYHFRSGNIKSKKVTEGKTGVAIISVWDGKGIDDFLSSAYPPSGGTKAEYIKDCIEQTDVYSPRYTNLDDKKSQNNGEAESDE